MINTWVQCQTLLGKEIRRILRIWPQTLLPPLITTTLYFLIFGHLIGPRIGKVAHIPYTDFIAPGLIMMAIITNAYSNTCTSFFSDRFQHAIEECIVAPMSALMIYACFVLGGMCRGMLTGAVVSLAAHLFTTIAIHHIVILISTLLLATHLFSCLGFLNALFAKHFDDISIIPTFILTPLIYLGGVFYHLDMLPAFWKQLSMFNPMVYIIHAFRYSMLDIKDFDIFPTLMILLGMNIGFAAIALFLFKRKQNWTE
jgi:ABC-2 type transport system permease protein